MHADQFKKCWLNIIRAGRMLKHICSRGLRRTPSVDAGDAFYSTCGATTHAVDDVLHLVLLSIATFDMIALSVPHSQH
jgi:hypothetical protein